MLKSAVDVIIITKWLSVCEDILRLCIHKIWAWLSFDALLRCSLRARNMSSLTLLSRILEREVLRSEQEYERMQAEAEVDAKRAADTVEDFNKKHEEA